MRAEQPEHWLVRLAVPPGCEDDLLARAALEGFGAGAAMREYPHGLLADEPDLSPREVEVHLWTPSAALPGFPAWLRAFAETGGWSASAIRSLSVEPADLSQDPELLWKAHWRPFRCAGFAVRADFHDPARLPAKSADLPLILVTGSAFGTGGHPTTRLALRAVRRISTLRRPARLLDVGTGSGILAVAAALLGARASGMDPDPQSPPQTLRMAELNGVRARVCAWRGTLDSAQGSWPAIVANLFSDLLEDSAPALCQLLEPGGVLFAGGIVDRSWERTRGRLEAVGMDLEEVARRGRWIGSYWVRRPARA